MSRGEIVHRDALRVLAYVVVGTSLEVGLTCQLGS